MGRGRERERERNRWRERRERGREKREERMRARENERERDDDDDFVWGELCEVVEGGDEDPTLPTLRELREACAERHQLLLVDVGCQLHVRDTVWTQGE